MGFDVTSWLLFLAVLVNQAGRVMIPAIKTSVLADDDFKPDFGETVGAMLSGVSLVCLGGKLLGAAVTDKLGGWLVLIVVFVLWLISTAGAIVTTSVPVFGAAWLLNSFAYTITWGSCVQVIGTTYEKDADRSAQLSKAASASRFGATFGNILFGQLLSAGLHWRYALLPILPVQAVLLLMCSYYWYTNRASSKPPAAPAKKEAAAASKPKEGAAGGATALQAFLSIDFWLMVLPKAVLFTYTQFFMNYIPQLLNVVYGYDHGAAATFGGVAQGGSVIGLLYVGNVLYKSRDKAAKVRLVALELCVCVAVPAILANGPLIKSAVGVDIAPLVVPLTVLWGLAYALPFYIPPGEFAMAVGGKSSTALYTNLFDAAGFTVSAIWNPWASGLAKQGDFATILYSQALFGALSLVCMPLCMTRVNAKAKKE